MSLSLQQWQESTIICSSYLSLETAVRGAATGPWRVGGGVWSRCQRRGLLSIHHHEVMGVIGSLPYTVGEVEWNLYRSFL